MVDTKSLKKFVSRKKILIDSNIIIYLTEKIEPFYPLSRELFHLVEEGHSEAIVSILTVAEVMQGPVKANEIDIALAVKNYLLNFPNCNCQQITFDVLDHVGKDPRINWQTLRTVDSLIIASGIEANVDLFISNDRHFIKSLPPEMLLSFA